MKNNIKALLLTLLSVTAIATKASTMKANVSTDKGVKIKHGMIIYTEIIINSTAANVWRVFTDFASYPEWNPFIKELTGTPVPGGRISVFLQPPGNSGMRFSPKVLRMEDAREMRWIGKLILPYIFDGEHFFALKDNGDGTCTFRQGEHFRGILVPFMHKMLHVNTRHGFELMNEALKRRCEQK